MAPPAESVGGGGRVRDPIRSLRHPRSAPQRVSAAAHWTAVSVCGPRAGARVSSATPSPLAGAPREGRGLDPGAVVGLQDRKASASTARVCEPSRRDSRLRRTRRAALMVIDTSALVPILQNEPERRRFDEAVEAAERRVMSVASFVETSMVIESRYGPDGRRNLDLFISKARIVLVPVDDEQAYVARDAFRHYGKGRHAAGLNFGDCFAYALAKDVRRAPAVQGKRFLAHGCRDAFRLKHWNAAGLRHRRGPPSIRPRCGEAWLSTAACPSSSPDNSGPGVCAAERRGLLEGWRVSAGAGAPTAPRRPPGPGPGAVAPAAGAPALASRPRRAPWSSSCSRCRTRR